MRSMYVIFSVAFVEEVSRDTKEYLAPLSCVSGWPNAFVDVRDGDYSIPRYLCIVHGIDAVYGELHAWRR